jgi:hypothetical protein
MKKLFFAAAFAAIGLVGVNAQTGVEGSLHVGIPVGDASKVSSFNLGADVAYLHPVASNFKVGAKVGYDHFFAKEGIKDFGFVPVAATAKYEFGGGSNIFIGADAGYAFSTTNHVDGGFLYQPKVGYSGATWDVYAGFKGIVISNDVPGLRNFNANTVNIGFAYKF